LRGEIKAEAAAAGGCRGTFAPKGGRPHRTKLQGWQIVLHQARESGYPETGSEQRQVASPATRCGQAGMRPGLPPDRWLATLTCSVPVQPATRPPTPQPRPDPPM